MSEFQLANGLPFYFELFVMQLVQFGSNILISTFKNYINNMAQFFPLLLKILYYVKHTIAERDLSTTRSQLN